jgi:MFS family permease
MRPAGESGDDDNRATVNPVLYLGPFVSSFDRLSIAPLLLPIAIEFHDSLAEVAIAATLYYLLFGLTQPIYGVLSDRFGRVPVIRASLVMVTVGSLASASAQSLLWLIVARTITGAAIGAIIPASLVYVADMYPYMLRQRAIVNVSVAVAVGNSAGLLGSGVLVTFVSWRAPFAITAILAGGLAVLMRGLPEPPRGSHEGAATRLRRVAHSGWARFVIGLAIADGIVFQGLTTYFAPALQSRGVIAALAGLVAAGYGVATVLAGQVVRRSQIGKSAPMLTAIGAGMLAVGYLSAAVSPGVVGILVASLLAGAAYAFLHSSLQTWATEVVPQARGTATALFALALFIGAAAATGLAAHPAEQHDYPLIFLTGGVCSVLIGVVATVSMRRYQRGLKGDSPA